MADSSIRLARVDDLDAVLSLYDTARAFMRANGNSLQWANGYPGLANARADLERDGLWVLDEGDGPLAVASILPGPEPTYDYIEGEWLNDEPYWVLHRLAVGEGGRGLGRRFITWFAGAHTNTRADTAEVNIPMRNLLTSCGFVHCGTIYVTDGTPRLAFQHLGGQAERPDRC